VDRLALCYHGVSDGWPEHTAVTPGRLEQHLERLLGRGFRPVTFSQLVTDRSSDRLVAVTFDDAHRSVLELAYDRLARLGVPATVFVVTGYAGTVRPMSWEGLDHWVGTEHEHELVSLDWDELGRLAEAGWEIGSHSVTHPLLSGLSDAELASELRDSRRACEERLGRSCRVVAYPYGASDARVAAAARDAGYSYGATVPLHPARPTAMEWPRAGIFRGDGRVRFAVKSSRTVRALAPLWRPALQLARRGSKPGSRSYSSR
jgi:peptidoglycan/xylan/chitin deacetylase (PgdA/CDA1 family)